MGIETSSNFLLQRKELVSIKNIYNIIERSWKIGYYKRCSHEIAHSAYRFNMYSIDFWLPNCVLPRGTMLFSHGSCANAFHIADNRSEHTTGFSRTKDTKLLFPVQIDQKFHHVKKLKEQTGKWEAKFSTTMVSIRWEEVVLQKEQSPLPSNFNQQSQSWSEIGPCLQWRRGPSSDKHLNKMSSGESPLLILFSCSTPLLIPFIGNGMHPTVWLEDATKIVPKS